MKRYSRLLPRTILLTVCTLGIFLSAHAQAEIQDEKPLWNIAWITDTQTPDCEWITTLLARLSANKPKIVIHTGDARFEWANRCAWKDAVDLQRVETPPIEFHLAPGNHDLQHGLLKYHLRKAATQGIYRLDTGLKAQGPGYYHSRVPENVTGPLWPVWNPEVVNHPAWQITANKKPAHWQHPDPPYHYVFKRGGIRFIVCDAFYTNEQKEWIRDFIVQPDDSSVSIVLHHKHEVDDLARYFDGLKGRHNVKLVLSGDHHQYCYEQRDGITYITAAGIYPGQYGDCDAMTLWVYKDHLRLDRYLLPKGLPMKPIQGPTTIWTCEGDFREYQRPEFPEKPAHLAVQSEKSGTIGPNLIKNGNYDNGIWYERYRGWSPSYWSQWFTRGGHVPEHAVGKRLPHSGKEYARLHMWAHAWRAGILQNVLDVEPCHMYRMTAYGFFQPNKAPEPNARIGIDPSGTLAQQFSVDVSKHPAPKYDEGVGDDLKTKKYDGPGITETTIWSDYHDYYSWGKFEVIAEAKSDTITAILYCSPQQRPAEKPIYEMNWDSVELYEIPWPTKRLVADDAMLVPDSGFKKVIVTVQPEFSTAQVTWKTATPSGASQVLYRFKDWDALAQKKDDKVVRSKIFLFETPVTYEKSEIFHRIEIKHPEIRSASKLELVALSRALVDGQCVTLCSPVVSISLANTISITSGDEADNWRDNIVPGASMSHHTYLPKVTLFKMQFADSDPWCYPIIKLKDKEIPDSSFSGLAFTVQLLEGEGTVRVQFVEESDTRYAVETNFKAGVRQPQRIRAMFNNRLWQASSPRDPDGRLTPENIKAVMVGINSKRHSTVKMVVSDLTWIK
jgi:predicted phosphodiesterase